MLLVAPWGLVVRVRELAWLNAFVTITQVGFAALADLWLIQRFALGGAVAAVALTTVLTIVLSFAAWRWFDRSSLAVPWSYALRCVIAALPYALLFPLAWVGLRLLLLLPVAALLTLVWLYLLRELRLLSRAEVPLLHDTRHVPIRFALRWLAPEPPVLRPVAAER